MAGSLRSGPMALGAGTFVLVLAALALVWGSSPPRAGAEAAARACANADTPPAEATRSEMRRAVACLIRRERVARERRAVTPNRALRRIAQRHSATMVKTNCFEHRCPGEASLPRRIERSGYVGPGDRYGYGEITGCALTPRKMVAEWMDTTVARRTILKRRFRDLGVGVVREAPEVAQGCDTPGFYATYTALFAWRRG